MAKNPYTIGFTEAGDGGIDLWWKLRLPKLDGIVLITKNLTPRAQDAILPVAAKAIVHATCTGYGGTVVEPNVPDYKTQLRRAQNLVNNGFPMSHMVIRVDPIIPTPKGIALAKTVMETAYDMGFRRFRISIIDMYPHVRDRFRAAGLPLPYGDNGFNPSPSQVGAVDDMVLELKTARPDIIIESCAEKDLQNTDHVGCLSAKDMVLMGLDPSKADAAGHQRSTCLCCSAKTELLDNKHPCPHQCLYCYWRTSAGK